MVRLELLINNKLGFHARAAGRFVETACRFESEIWVLKETNRVNGKSIMGILTLAAARGETVILEVDGQDEEEAARCLGELVKGGFGENERPDRD